jgi:dihydropteroate synthase
MKRNYPKIMGILNCTPDSFSDGGLYLDVDAAVARAAQMIQEGATIIDVGGESTRPGSDPVSTDEEFGRVLPVLERCIKRWPEVRFSIDTTKYEVALESLKLGAHYINDVSGLRKEPRFIALCAKYNAGLIIMHSVGDPKTMQNNPEYGDVVEQVLVELTAKAQDARRNGVSEVIIDPGIGFGKTLEHNLALLQATKRFCDTGFPVLIGASRKAMIGTLLGNRPSEGRLAGTLAVHYHALMLGAHILRVHDVQEAHDTLVIFRSMKSGT